MDKCKNIIYIGTYIEGKHRNSRNKSGKKETCLKLESLISSYNNSQFYDKVLDF